MASSETGGSNARPAQVPSTTVGRVSAVSSHTSLVSPPSTPTSTARTAVVMAKPQSSVALMAATGSGCR